jgi:hypothetical protein
MDNIGSFAMKAGIVVVAGLVLLAGHYFFHLPDNSSIETMAEQVIKEQTGVDIQPSSLPNITSLKK